MLRVVTDESTREEATSTPDEICREGARRMLAAALEAETDAYIAELVGELDESGRRLVTRNGHARMPRRLLAVVRDPSQMGDIGPERPGGAGPSRRSTGAANAKGALRVEGWGRFG